MDVAQNNVDDADVSDYVTLWQADYFEWLENPCRFDMLHLDISNDGYIIDRTLCMLASQIAAGAIVVFEGGSVERDEVEWMKKFKKRPINPLQEKFGFEILDERFPSISIMMKR
jgi:tRNA A58 N-methylase Trm61